MSALVQHKDLVGSDVHEPKGADTASNGDVYVADGAGSGSFQAPAAPAPGTVDHGGLTGLTDDDHPQYLNEARHDALPADNPHSVTFTQVGADAAGTAAAAVTSHEGSANPHPQYLTETSHDALPADNPHGVTAAQVGADTVGTAAALISAHEAALDPHTQYHNDARALLWRDDLYYEVFDTSAQTLTATDAIVVMNTEESANAEYSLASGQVTVNFTGRVKISYSFSGDSNNNTRSIARSTIYQNGTAVARSQMDSYHRTTGAGEQTSTRQILLSVTNGDTLHLRSRIISGTGVVSVANGSSILVERIA